MVELLNQWLPNVMDRPDVFIKSIQETFIMVGWSGAISFVVGLFLGVLITVTKPGNILEHKGVVLNLSGATLTWNGMELELTRNELRILELLFSQAGRPVSRDAIMTKLWESDSFVDDNTLTVNITRLRKKLEAAGLADFIITRKGLGYMV